MVTLEQIKLLESKIGRAVDFVNRALEENARLKKQNEELGEAIAALRDEKSRVEEGIVSALGRLNQFEDAIERGLSAVGQTISPGPVPYAPGTPPPSAPPSPAPAVPPVQAAASVQTAPPAQTAAAAPVRTPAQPAPSPSPSALPGNAPAVPSAYLVDEDEEADEPEETEETEDSGEAELDLF
ncbi:MAG: cell division protein ZapB [Treponema sp.]|jgi:hypothetical protein|nr:cell division protein ZapB [Treponema sp.]